jgi:FlaA1/EpsC-like NDP-sugar epimerase
MIEDYIEDKVLCISGGTGYLGRNLVREVLKYKPRAIRAFSRDGGKVERMQKEFEGFDNFQAFVADTLDKDRMNTALWKADCVIHCAAEKRINVCEESPLAAKRNNVDGTESICHAALTQGVKRFINISTDKAFNPITMYGYTKALAEQLVSHYNNLTKRTKFASVRYGNILFSTDSVLNKWDSLYPNEVLEVTDPEMTRFYMSIDSAVKLVLESLWSIQGGEVFIKDDMKALKVSDILASRYPNARTKIIGLRGQEKLHEELKEGYSSKDNVISYKELMEREGVC